MTGPALRRTKMLGPASRPRNLTLSFGHRSLRGVEMIKGFLLILAFTATGISLGFAALWGLWEITHVGHPREDFSGFMLGVVLGAPGGGIAGFLVGTILAIRWFRPRQ